MHLKCRVMSRDCFVLNWRYINDNDSQLQQQSPAIVNAINHNTSLTCHDTRHDNGLQSWLQSSTTISVNAHEMWKDHNRCMRVLQSNTRDVVKGHNGLQQCACSNTVCQRHSMHRHSNTTNIVHFTSAHHFAL